MSWNYRIIASESEGGEMHFAVHECYYSRKTAKTPNSMTVDPVSVGAESPAALKRVLTRMRVACTKPILTHKNGKIVKYRPTARPRAKITA